MNIKQAGVDLAKNVFQLHGVERRGCTSSAHRITLPDEFKNSTYALRLQACFSHDAN